MNRTATSFRTAPRVALQSRSRATRHFLAVRGYVTAPPPPLGSAPKPDPPSNRPMYLALGTGAGLLLYWYAYGDHKSTKGLEEKAKKDEEELKRKAVEATDAGKARAYDAYKQAESKYNDAKRAADSRLNSAKNSVDGAVDDIERRVREAKKDMETKYDAYINSAKDRVSQARHSSEELYHDAGTRVNRSADEAKAGVDKGVQDVKRGWFSWLGWGESKLRKGEHDAAREVAVKAEDVRRKAEDYQ